MKLPNTSTSGRAPVRVLDPQTARILTPPGPLGKHDVKITLGATSATLPKGFEYRQAGLMPPWQQKMMAKVRGEHPGLAVLQDGRTIVTGGTTKPDDAFTAQDTAELFDRKTETVAFAANTMGAPRWFSSAVTLLDGRVLVYGGACTVGNAMNCTGNLKSADLFDPSTNMFSPAKPLTVDRYWTYGVLLPDARVLVASANDPSIEVYDPDADTFTKVGQLAEAHVLGFMARLRDGRVLIGGGFQGAGAGTAALFDPDTNALQPVGNLVQPRGWLTAHTLPDGRVAVVGGTAPVTNTYTPLLSIEVFDPQSKMFSTSPVMLQKPRFAHASALVRDGSILVLGGYVLPTACMPPADTNTVDQIDLVQNKVTTFASLAQARVESNAVTLLDGSVLHVAGGHCGTQVAQPYLDFLAGAPGPN